MFQLVFFILFTSGFTESQGKKLLCRSSDVEISYSFCDSMDHVFFLGIVPCSFSEGRWKITLLWIPRSDIIFLEGSMDLWYDAANVFQGKEVICHGFDDDYSFCGTLKGETVNTTFELSGLKMQLPKTLFIVAMEDYQQPLLTYLKRLMLTSPRPHLLTSAA
ncbi:lymphocyte antigen 96 isoform X1 [Chelonia mydas]|uniref:lymphocyte antigen 96 isoform X1 n=1 Tax=Chelonia mydas TaxID=8469 RepID=UPI0018A208C4|nr:lymphocyte antigen 96 isoform X1 [Chelonia mydas]XP_037748347.1 lymphocyte antigen 96 isoform X1 [Chelonia mydas]